MKKKKTQRFPGLLHSLIKTYFLAIFFLPGCVQREKLPRDTLVIGIESEVKNLNPITTIDANGWNVIQLFTQSLMRIGSDLQPETDLALNFEQIDNKVFKFELSKDSTFHNGKALTCDDVLFSYEQASGPTSRAQSYFKELERFECPDPQHFVIRLKKSDLSFIFNVVTLIRILPRDLPFQKEYDSQPIASGPFRFIKKQHRDLIFERFENFQSFEHGQRRILSSFKKLIVRSVQDPTTRHLSLEGGDLDIVINALSPKKVQEAAKNPRLQVHRSPGTTFQYVGLNFRNPKFKNPKVRWALAHAVPREEIIRHKFNGFAIPASGLFSPQNVYYNPRLHPPEYNLEKARKLLKEAGVKDLSLEIKSSSDREVASFLLIIKEEWEKLGLQVSLKPFEFATFFSQVQKGDFEAYSLRWTQVVDPDIMNKIYHSKEVPPGRNRIYYKNPEVDHLLEAAKLEDDFEKRKALYFKAQEEIYKDMPYIPLWYPENVAVSQKNLVGFKMLPTADWRAAYEARKE